MKNPDALGRRVREGEVVEYPLRLPDSLNPRLVTLPFEDLVDAAFDYPMAFGYRFMTFGWTVSRAVQWLTGYEVVYRPFWPDWGYHRGDERPDPFLVRASRAYYYERDLLEMLVSRRSA